MIIKIIILILLGLITSYEDIRFGKIRNIWIIIGLVFGLIFFDINNSFNFGISIILEIGRASCRERV